MKRIFLEMEKLKNLNSGLGQVCLALGNEFVKADTKNFEFHFYVPDQDKKLFGSQTKYIQQSKVHQFLKLNSDEFDVWHCLHQDSAYFPKNKKTKLILTIHDLNFLEKYSGLRRLQKLAALQRRVDRAQVITVISHFTEAQVRKHLQLKGQSLHVIPNGNSLHQVNQPEKPDFIQCKDFIFTIGGVLAKKNFHVLLPLLTDSPDLHLVIAGPKDTRYAREIKRLAVEHKVQDRLHMHGPVSEAQKYWLYQNCRAFVFPSLQEGFGLPVVEAMSLGKPVFLSRGTSLPEVGGSEAYYWDHFEPEYMKEVFKKGMNDFDHEKSKRIMEWAKQFSWENAAKAFLKIYLSD